MNLNRRQLLIFGLTGGAALAGAGLLGFAPAGGVLDDPGHRYGVLNEADRAVLAAVVPVILDGALPAENPEESVRAVLRDIDGAIGLLPLRVRAELRQLFDLLDGKLGRVVLAGVWASWAQASPEAIDGFLNDWRGSYLDLLRTAYGGLHELVLGVWYGNPASWPTIRYPGPPAIV